MSLERILETHNLLATLMKLSWQLWNSTGTALAIRHEATKGAGGFYGFLKGHVWACWKNSAARLLMPHEITHGQNRVAVVNSVITKIFNPCKYWTVTIQPFVKTLNPSVSVLFVTSLLFNFCSLCFLLFDSVLLFNYSMCDFSVYFLFWYWNCIPGISIPYFINKNHPTINEHHKSDSAIFVLV